MTDKSRDLEAGRKARRKAETEAARDASAERNQPDDIATRARMQRQGKKQHLQDGK